MIYHVFFTTDQGSALPICCLCHQRPRTPGPKFPRLGANHPRPPKCLVWTLWPEQCVKTNSTPSVHIKIAGLKWMFIPLKIWYFHRYWPIAMFQLNPNPFLPGSRTHARISRLRWNWARFGVRPIGGPNLRHGQAPFIHWILVNPTWKTVESSRKITQIYVLIWLLSLLLCSLFYIQITLKVLKHSSFPRRPPKFSKFFLPIPGVGAQVVLHWTVFPSMGVAFDNCPTKKMSNLLVICECQAISPPFSWSCPHG